MMSIYVCRRYVNNAYIDTLQAEENIIDKLPRLLQNSNIDLVVSTLKLLFNLSFDVKLRARMIRVGMLPKWVKLLGQGKRIKRLILKQSTIAIFFCI